MKKNTIKLKELSALQKNSDNEGEIRINVRFVQWRFVLKNAQTRAKSHRKAL